MKNPKKIGNFQNFQIFKIFGKNRFFKKTFQSSNCSKKFAFLRYDQTKKTATRFYHEDYISKKLFGARAFPRAARADSHIAVKTQKSWFFGIGGRIF